jgi:uncharacterized protein YwgA
MVLLAKEEKKFKTSFVFDRWHYGPYSPDLQNLLDDLVACGFVEERQKIAGYEYRITKSGGELLLDLQEKIPVTEQQKIQALWDKYKNCTNEFIIQRAKEAYGW